MIERHGRRNPCGIYEKALPPGGAAQRADAAASAGYDFVELAVDDDPSRLARLDWTSSERRDVRAAYNDAGAPVRTLVLSAHRRWPWGSGDAQVRGRAAQLASQAIELASDLGADTIQIAGYFTYHEPSTTSSRQYFIEGLERAADKAARSGVVLALENMDGHDVLSAADAVAIVGDVPSVRLYVDVGNFAGNGLAVLDELAGALPYTHAVQLKDSRPGVFRRVPFGEGDVPFGDVLGLLYDIGYTGRLSVEMWNDDGDMDSPRRARRWFAETVEEMMRPRAGGGGCGCH